MPTRYLRSSQSFRVDSRSPKWPSRNGSLLSSSRTRARLGARTDRCNSIVARFTNAAATGVSTHIEPPASPAAMRSKLPVAHLAAFREWGSVPSCRAIEPHRSRSTLNGGFYLCRVIGLSPRRTSGNRPVCGKFARVDHFTDNRIREVTRPQSRGLDQSALPVQARRILSDSPIKLPARFNVPMR